MRLGRVLPSVLPSAWWRVRFAAARWWQLRRRSVLRLLVMTLAATLVYGAWPYATLWSLNQALVRQDRAAMAELVDLTAIRREIIRRLDKDRTSTIGRLSDDFIRTLESEIRRHGTNAVDVMVTLDWVKDHLASKSRDGRGFLPELAYGCFDGPTAFEAHLGRSGDDQVDLRLHLDGARWRLVMLAY